MKIKKENEEKHEMKKSCFYSITKEKINKENAQHKL